MPQTLIASDEIRSANIMDFRVEGSIIFTIIVYHQYAFPEIKEATENKLTLYLPGQIHI